MDVQELKKVKTQSLTMVDPFESLFSVDTEAYKQTYSKVYINMDLLGFDETQPIIVWKGRNIVIDGHTRLRAALEKGIEEVWVIEKEFLNDDDAIQYVVHLQRDRRKVTDADIFHLVKVLDKRHPQGRPSKTASVDAISNPSRASNLDNYHKELIKLADYKDEYPASPLPKTPYPKNGPPETALNLAIHERIPNLDDNTEVGRVCFQNLVGGRKLVFRGDLREGLSEFKEWAYGRSDDITATLIGTSRAKVDKCRHIIDPKNKNIDIEYIKDIQDKVLRGKLTINRAYLT